MVSDFVLKGLGWGVCVSVSVCVSCAFSLALPFVLFYSGLFGFVLLFFRCLVLI